MKLKDIFKEENRDKKTKKIILKRNIDDLKKEINFYNNQIIKLKIYNKIFKDDTTKRRIEGTEKALESLKERLDFFEKKLKEAS